ncbi:hypothetical protein [Legionella beliardensis]|nr:hypothetical protein [Legionella beliardensis]
MATLAGRVVSELQVQSREKPVSVQVVKGYRELLYPESRQEGRLITTRSDVRKKGEYYRFYQPGSPSNQSNIDEKKAKNDAQVLTEEGRVKSIKIKL